MNFSNTKTAALALIAASILSLHGISDANAGGYVVKRCCGRTAHVHSHHSTNVINKNLIVNRVNVAVVAPPAIVLKPSSRVGSLPPVMEVNPEIREGQVVTMTANFMSPESGYVLLRVRGMTLQARITSWGGNAVQFEVPAIGLGGQTRGQIQIVLPTGRLLKSVDINLLPRADIFPHPMGPTQSDTVPTGQPQLPVQADPASLQLG